VPSKNTHYKLREREWPQHQNVTCNNNAKEYISKEFIKLSESGDIKHELTVHLKMAWWKEPTNIRNGAIYVTTIKIV